MRRSLAGIFICLLMGCGGGGGGGSSNPTPSNPPPNNPSTPANQPPSVPEISHSPELIVPGVPITFVASSTDPQDSSITYAWSFGDGATDSGAQVEHTFEDEGSYTVRVTATNALQLSSSWEVLVLVEHLPPSASVFPAEAGVILGQFVRLGVAATDPNGLGLTYSWDFGDGDVGFGSIVDHRYTAVGEFDAVVTVTNSAGKSRTATARVEVRAPAAQPALVDDQFSVYCSGAYCGALDASTYSGSGVGIWRYHNSTASDATIDVQIDGVQGAKRATLVFSNGEPVGASGVPSAGSPATSLSETLSSSQLSGSEPAAHDAHFAIVEENQRIARAAARVSGKLKNDTSLRRKGAVRRKPAPALGTTRVWNVSLSDPYEHTMAVAATCPLSDGRNAVFWVDAASYAEEQISATKLNRLTDSFCGSEGSYAQLVALVGDVWGPEAQSNPDLIQDSPEEFQDFHIVIPYVSQATSWGGYFASGNLLSKAVSAASNEALAVFLNGRYFAQAPDEDWTQASQLVHELKHHINFYQRSVRHGAAHDAWLEETSAMMTEDILPPPNEYGESRTQARMHGYANSGGGIGYVDWTHSNGHSYNQGGTFAGFLNRHFGLGIHRDLVEECRDGGVGSTSYECVDDLIKKYGGHGFADAFARMGVTTFALIRKVSSPLGFGLPGVEHDGRFLSPIDFRSLLEYPPRDLAGTFLATSHTYQEDEISEGQTSYVRTDVVVPGKTTLILVIQ